MLAYDIVVCFRMDVSSCEIGGWGDCEMIETFLVSSVFIVAAFQSCEDMFCTQALTLKTLH